MKRLQDAYLHNLTHHKMYKQLMVGGLKVRVLNMEVLQVNILALYSATNTTCCVFIEQMMKHTCGYEYKSNL